MRPSDTEAGEQLYECSACGAREVDPETQQCDGCGGELLNLGRPRDL